WQHRRQYDRLSENIASIDFLFENVESLKVERKDIVSLWIRDLWDAQPYAAGSINILEKAPPLSHQLLSIRMKNEAEALSNSGRHYHVFERLNEWNDTISVAVCYQDGSTRQFPLSWPKELDEETDGMTDYYQKHSHDVKSGRLTGTFTSRFIINRAGETESDQSVNN
ncbi:MAG: hypothetical protein IJM79_01230, partial [Erysipelotrichaceae bacterium]|nr:hypothetical protein [Erysipelotrichaceae bacterium]